MLMHRAQEPRLGRRLSLVLSSLCVRAQVCEKCVLNIIKKRHNNRSLRYLHMGRSREQQCCHICFPCLLPLPPFLWVTLCTPGRFSQQTLGYLSLPLPPSLPPLSSFHGYLQNRVPLRVTKNSFQNLVLNIWKKSRRGGKDVWTGWACNPVEDDRKMVHKNVCKSGRDVKKKSWRAITAIIRKRTFTCYRPQLRSAIILEEWPPLTLFWLQRKKKNELVEGKL